MSLCGYLSVGQLNNGKRPACFTRTVCLRIGPFITGNRAGARVRSFDLAIGNKRSTTMTTFSRRPFAKTTANCSNSFCHFHLISSASWPRRPLIMFACFSMTSAHEGYIPMFRAQICFSVILSPITNLCLTREGLTGPVRLSQNIILNCLCQCR